MFIFLVIQFCYEGIDLQLVRNLKLKTKSNGQRGTGPGHGPAPDGGVCRFHSQFLTLCAQSQQRHREQLNVWRGGGTLHSQWALCQALCQVPTAQPFISWP